ncbi:bcl-2-binding component 3 isoform X2 [Scophthalmus maximus]|uniref:bcl-2-binding component 3 isoform X2 n=1 Tax=Scophthalmus maximus TaxID=52904 RepID=UPI0015E05F0C|nr:bcl-2-binding component 3 isoform X2 [Scophthalmus maximus]
MSPCCRRFLACTLPHNGSSHGPKTIEGVGETGGGGNGPLPRHNTCRMELPRPLHSWPGLLTTTTTITSGPGTGRGAIHLHHHHHHLHPTQPLHLSHPQAHQQFPALPPSPPSAPPPSPLCNQREERDGGAVKPSALSGEESDLDLDESQEASRRQGPLPDLLPQTEHPSWASPHHRAPRGEAVQELEVRRVASQLRAIGDQLNATIFRRAHVAPQWQDWRDACRGLLNLITQTLSTLYRLT